MPWRRRNPPRCWRALDSALAAVARGTPLLAGGGARRTDPLIQLAGQDEFRPHQRGDALPRDNQGEKACCLTEECSHEVARCLIKDVPIAS
jgi:hypothetical protein